MSRRGYWQVLAAVIVVLLVSHHTSGMSIDQMIAAARHGRYPWLRSRVEEIRELDMILTDEEWNVLRGYSRNEKRYKRKGVLMLKLIWPDKKIPFKIEPHVFKKFEENEIMAAINDWRNYTCLTMEEATESDPNFLKFEDGDGCASRLGMRGGSQSVYLGEGCRRKGIVVHEIGHAVGFFHEHSRPDRDDHVEIATENITEELLPNFIKFPPDVVSTSVQYDYQSVMHYGAFYMSPENRITIKTKNSSYQLVIGNQFSMSFLDIKQANMMYQCDSHCLDKPVCPDEGFVGKDCKCWCPGTPRNPTVSCGGSPAERNHETKQQQESNCKDDKHFCEHWANAGYCYENEFVQANCKKSCGLCKDAASGCTDRAPICKLWESQGLCQNENAIDYLKAYCSLTCKFCSPEREFKFASVMSENRSRDSAASVILPLVLACLQVAIVNVF